MEKQDNKKDVLFVISQVCVLLNCYICFLGIYESFLQPLSWVLIPLAFICLFLSRPFSSIKGNTVVIIEIVLFAYVLAGELVHSNLHRLGSQMMLSAFVFFFFMNAFYSSTERAGLSYQIILQSIAIMSSIVAVASFCYFLANHNLLSGNDYLKGVTVNRNHLGIFSAIGAMAAIALVWKGGKKLSLLYTCMLIINAGCMLYVQSRAAMLAFFAMLFFYMIWGVCQVQSRLGKILIVAGFIFFGLLLLIFIFERNNVDIEQPASIVLNNVSSGRVNIWKACFDIAKSHPWLGVSGLEYEEYLTARLGFTISSHNVFLSLASGNGFPAALLYFALLVVGFVQGIVVILKSGSEDRYEAFMLLGMLVGCSVADLLDTYSMAMHIPNAFLVFFSLGQIQYRYSLCKKT